MNARQGKNSQMVHGIFHADAGRRIPAAVVMLGLILATASGTGQDRIRIVEPPRTAMRVVPDVAPPSRPAVQAEPGGVPDQASAGYAEHFVTEMQDHYRTVYVPVIESQTEPTSAWWDPLGISARTFQPRPVVRWEPRVEKSRVPIRYREVVAETTELPQGRRRTASSNGAPDSAVAGDRTRAPIRATRGSLSRPTVVLPETQFGGITRFESDQPRYGTRPGFQEQRVIR